MVGAASIGDGDCLAVGEGVVEPSGCGGASVFGNKVSDGKKNDQENDSGEKIGWFAFSIGHLCLIMSQKKGRVKR